MWLLIVILAVVILLGVIPVRLAVEYGENGFYACISVLVFKFKFPRKTTKHASSENISKEKANKKNPGSMKALTVAIKPILQTLGKLMRMLCVRKLVANITLASDDAFSTAMMYGGAAAGIGTIFPFINNLKIKKKYILVRADFESNETVVYLFADISILIWQVILLVVYFLYQYLKKLSSTKKKGTNENG